MTEVQHQMDPGRLLDHGFHGLTQSADVRLFENLLVRKGYDGSLIFIFDTYTRLNCSHNGLPIRHQQELDHPKRPDGPCQVFCRTICKAGTERRPIFGNYMERG